MSEQRVRANTFTVLLNFTQAAVMTWAALSTGGAVHVALWCMVGLYVVCVLAALVVYGGRR